MKLLLNVYNRNVYAPQHFRNIAIFLAIYSLIGISNF